jgi:ABC-type lipoprotein export system ATPase subunit
MSMSDNTQSKIIQVEQVSRVYQLQSFAPVHALSDINLTLQDGIFYAFKGRSGSGKTTLLNCISTLDKPTEGTVTVFGESVSQFDLETATNWRRLHVGFIFQTFGLTPTLSAYENVEIMLRLNNVHPDERHERVVECLDMVGLKQRANHRPHELSGGQQQRVAIARSLANKPSILIADEPTGELDSKTACDIFALFKSIVQIEGLTILMATHDPLADDYVDQIINLKDGRIIE